MTDERSAWAAGIGTFMAPVTGILETYVFGDFDTVWFLLLLVGVDTALGFRLAWKKKAISSLAFSRVIDKLLVYLCLLAAAFAVARMGGANADSWVFMGLRWLVVSYIFVREFLSIVEKADRMGVSLPAWITRPLKDYAERGTVKSTESNSPDKQG